MYERSRSSWVKHLDFIFLDLVLLMLSFVSLYFFRNGGAFLFNSHSYSILLIVILLIHFLLGVSLRNYSDILRRGWIREVKAVFIIVFGDVVIISMFLFLTKMGSTYSRITLIGSYLHFFFFSYLVRQLYKIIVLKRLAKFNKHSRTAVLVTDAANAEHLLKILTEDNLSKIYVMAVAFFGERSLSKGKMGVEACLSIDEAADFICREWIDEVFICSDHNDPRVNIFIDNCRQMGITMHYFLPLKEVSSSKRFIENFGGTAVITTTYNYMTATQVMLKRLMDILGGLVGCFIALIIALFIGPKIKKESPGPLIYKQERIGKNGRRFTIYKFRSMYLDADQRKAELMAENRISDGMMFKMEFDPRIIGNKVLPDGTQKTGIGEFIRSHSLDEFPQFFNVLKGDMSLVGTRPPTLDEWEKYEYHHRARMAIKPGITGMWQVSGRSQITDFDKVVELDTDYISNYCLALDIKILWKTVKSIFSKEGAM